LFGSLILVFTLLPPSQPFVDYYYVSAAVLWDKVIAFLLIFPTVMFSEKLSSPRRVALLFFLISFVGNQADNMWGSVIFSVPAVYEGVFGLPLDVVRSLFVLSPFVYPAIRFVQAFVAMVIAVPLMSALKGTKWIIGLRSLIEH
jgi:hypothetical protein